ncbi:MAG: RNA methyltransferase [Candidatus Lokiarchaeota archaeon]|nr:RNA methyltransferase [Candidatus Lokiarchaeota archaeon]
MLENFNFIISCRRFLEKDCANEIWYFFSLIGDDKSKCRPTNMPGLVTAKTELDPIQAINQLIQIVENDPYSFRFSLKIVPIQICVDSNLDDIKQAILDLKYLINENDSFKLEIKKRYSDFKTPELIQELADLIDNKVNLTSPDKIVRIEIIGKRTGVSILEPKQILRLEKIKQDSLF